MSPSDPARPEQILDTWFANPEHWWEPDPAFDERLRVAFGADLDAALRGELEHWAATPRGALARVILLDQISRNLHRGTPRMYDGDAKALATCLASLDRGDDASLGREERYFLYMPLMHSEDPSMQQRSLEKFRALGEGVEWAEHHSSIVFRFGRFPHRNAILGRESTPAERAYLAEPDPGFRGAGSNSKN